MIFYGNSERRRWLFLCPLIVLEMSSPDGNESNSSIGGENRKLLFERSVMNCGVRRTRGSAYFLNFFWGSLDSEVRRQCDNLQANIRRVGGEQHRWLPRGLWHVDGIGWIRCGDGLSFWGRITFKCVPEQCCCPLAKLIPDRPVSTKRVVYHARQMNLQCDRNYPHQDPYHERATLGIHSQAQCI